MGWKTKLALDTLKACIPFGTTVRRLKRQIVPYQPDRSIDSFTVEQGLQMVELLRANGVKLEGASILEIGSGWQPLIPLIFRLAGARQVSLTDRQVLLDRKLIGDAVDFLRSKATLIASRLDLPAERLDAVLTLPSGDDLSTALSALDLAYLAPADLRSLAVPTHSFDVITSRAVLEHIPPQLLAEIFAACRRLLKPGGTVCHIVDISDHWQHTDRSISRVNFLKYEEWLWWLTGLNALNYQNRLRHYELIALLADAGYSVVHEQQDLDPQALQALSSMHICRRYRNVEHRQLAGVTSYLVARSSS